MSTKYKFDDKEGVYFITSTVVGWIDVFGTGAGLLTCDCSLLMPENRDFLILVKVAIGVY